MSDTAAEVNMMLDHTLEDQTPEELFMRLLALGVCAKCRRNTENIHLYPPHCDHRLCQSCRRCPPPKCPICTEPINPKLITPDLAYKWLWHQFANEFDEATFKRYIQESEASAADAHSASSHCSSKDNDEPHCTTPITKDKEERRENHRSSEKCAKTVIEKDRECEPKVDSSYPKHGALSTSPKNKSKNAPASRPYLIIISDDSDGSDSPKEGANSRSRTPLKRLRRPLSTGPESRRKYKTKPSVSTEASRDSSVDSEPPSPIEEAELDTIGFRGFSEDPIQNRLHEKTHRAKTPVATSSTTAATPLQTPLRTCPMQPSPSCSSETPPVSISSTAAATPRQTRPIQPSPSCSSEKYLKRNAKGETKLHQYCSLGFKRKSGFSLDGLREMLSEGANPNTRDASGITPLDECVYYDNLEIMQVLLDGGALVNAFAEPAYTPLHRAVERYADLDLTPDSIPFKIITTLLDYGADTTLRNVNRLTVWDLARGQPAICSLLRSYRPRLVERAELLAPEPPMVVLPCTRNSPSLSDMFQRFKNRFKVTLLPEQRGFNPLVTHLVVPLRTKEANQLIRLAILSGCYVVTTNWVKESLAQDIILPAEDYEIEEPLVLNCKSEYPTRAARINRLHLRPKLFAGGTFHIVGSRDWQHGQRDSIAALVKTGGGSVLVREPKSADEIDEEGPKLYHAPDGSPWEKCRVFILIAHAHEHRFQFRMDHIKHVPLTWFYDCIDTYSIRDE